MADHDRHPGEEAARGVVENKALVRRFYEEVWDRGNFEFGRAAFADDPRSPERIPAHSRVRAVADEPRSSQRRLPGRSLHEAEKQLRFDRLLRPG